MRRDLIVPKGQCPLDVLAEQGEKIRNTWIFLHESVLINLRESEGVTCSGSLSGSEILTWEATGDTIACCDFERTGWSLLNNVQADDIAFDAVVGVTEPEEVIFVKMEVA